ncbi:MAG: Asp/Glu racemase [Pseudomonadota bacterium]
MDFSYSSIPQEERKPTIGLVVLQSDETVEPELHHWLPADKYDVFVSRVPSGEEVTEETLGAMANSMTHAASLFPRPAAFDAVAYCCTSGTSVIGSQKVAELIQNGCTTSSVTNPLSALVWACEKQGIKRLAFLSPYVEAVSARLRDVIAEHSIDTSVFGSFNEGREAAVAWIDAASIREAATTLVKDVDVDGVFLSCTNLKTRELLGSLSQEIGKPVLSSNFVLAEHLKELAS